MRIMTDAAADFTAEELERYGVHSIATGVMLNGEAVDPDHPLSDEEFWQQVLAGAAVKTSQPSPGAFAEAFEQAQSEDQDVLYVSISSALSGTMQSAQPHSHCGFPHRRGGAEAAGAPCLQAEG